MDELEFKGQKYISSKRAAEITGYAKDYIGQLARGGKVPATRVGRAWYVEREAIMKLAGVGEPTLSKVVLENSTVDEVRETEPPQLHKEVQEVHTPSPKHSLHSLQTSHASSGHSNPFKTWSSVQYLKDNSELLPSIAKKQPVGTVTLKKKYTAPREEKHSIVMQRSRHHDLVHGSVDGITIPNQEDVQKPLDDSGVRHKTLLLKPQFMLLTASFAVLLLGVSSVAGIVVPSNWVLSSQVASSEYLGSDIQSVLEVFFFIFESGATLLGGFLITLFGSLGEFLDIGINFILDLFYLG